MSDVLDHAEAYGRAGQYAKSAASYEVALADASMTAGERAHVLAHLSAAYRLSDRVDDAIRVAREGIKTGVSSADRSAEAHAHLALATALLTLFQSSENWEGFGEVMESLDRSASLYEQLGSIDFGTTLLTMAEAFKQIGELDAAQGVYARVTRDLSDPRWATPDSIARHADHLRGRAFVGLAWIAVDRELQDQAVDYFEAAVNLLVASREPVGASILEEIADWFESDRSDTAAAKLVRNAANGLVRSSS
jgi:tetratricopeptide (TPR) repeat protein